MDNNLQERIEIARRREMVDDHLSQDERNNIIMEIRIQENIPTDVNDEEIFISHIVD